MGFSQSKHQPPNKSNPYLQFLIYGMLMNDEERASNLFNYKPEVSHFFLTYYSENYGNYVGVSP